MRSVLQSVGSQNYDFARRTSNHPNPLQAGRPLYTYCIAKTEVAHFGAFINKSVRPLSYFPSKENGFRKGP